MAFIAVPVFMPSIYNEKMGKIQWKNVEEK